jgi:NADH:ubiquinone oxidoreductase subunit 3 (subunit A)
MNPYELIYITIIIKLIILLILILFLIKVRVSNIVKKMTFPCGGYEEQKTFIESTNFKPLMFIKRNINVSIAFFITYLICFLILYVAYFLALN